MKALFSLKHKHCLPVLYALLWFKTVLLTKRSRKEYGFVPVGRNFIQVISFVKGIHAGDDVFGQINIHCKDKEVFVLNSEVKYVENSGRMIRNL